jgi:peptidoglycan L-alanyl-D-glutamate endopeptidase CwlK
MINSRSLDDLLPPVRTRAEAFIAACKEAGIELLVTSTYRDHDSQAALYAQGRTKPGLRITNAMPGRSYHNWRVALDVVPIVHGKPLWSTTGPYAKLWDLIGRTGESVGLEWAGRWTHFPEFAHFQYTGGLTLTQLARGEVLA